jgi:hypothetical protein
MAFVIHSDEQHKILYGRETTFGTPLALDATSYKGIEFEKGQFFDLGINKSNLNANRSSRLLSLVDLYHDNYTGPVGYSFTTYLSKDRAADLLYAITQNKVSEGGGETARQKVFRMHASQPDFSANAGYFATMIWDSPETGKDARLTSGILRELTLTWDKTGAGESNLVKASGVWLFKKYEIDQTFTGSGTARDMTLAYKAHDFSMHLTLSSGEITSANWSKFSLTLTNNAVAIDRDSNGYPVTYFLNPGEGLKASAEVWYTGNYVTALTDYASGATVKVELIKGTTSTDGYFAVVANGKLTRTPLSTDNNMMRIPIELQLGNTTASGTDACDITIADDTPGPT